MKVFSTLSLCLVLQPSLPSRVQVIVYPGHQVPVMDTQALREAFRTEYNMLGNSNKPQTIAPKKTTAAGNPEYNKYSYKLINRPNSPQPPPYRWLKGTSSRPTYTNSKPNHFGNNNKPPRPPVSSVHQLIENF